MLNSFLFFRIVDALDKINRRLDEQAMSIANIQNSLTKMNSQPKQTAPWSNLNVISLIVLALGVVFHGIFMWILSKK